MELGPDDFTVCVEVWSRLDDQTWFGGDEYTATFTIFSRSVFPYDSHAVGRREQFSRVYVRSQPCLGAYNYVGLVGQEDMVELREFIGYAAEVDV